jgi:murein DD-endopeptidase MepM/ murein hydrolase activator NlpD
VLVVLGMFAGAFAAAAFDGDNGRPLGVQVDWLAGAATPKPTAQASPEPTQATEEAATPQSSPTPAVVTGFAYPIAGGCLPQNDDLMPGAPRQYRNGIHEGMDFYDADNCTLIGLDTEVLAAKAGKVVRADLDYQDITPDEVAALEQEADANGSSEPIEDKFRGRQVWIDHGNGIITRYAHLHAIADGIVVGKRVKQGDLIAYAGESGTPESVTDPGTQVHLHFEIRLGAGYLGKGLPPDEVRQLYLQAFEQ